MSHYIQDTMVVLKSLDNKLMLFTKGGDNNVASNESNKRCTSWWFNGVFENADKFNAWVDIVMRTDINGGSWQFQSLKGKSFDGFTKYDATVYRRFDKAIKRAKQIDWKLSDVTVDNIEEFEKAIFYLFRVNKFSLTDQDKCSIRPSILSCYYKEEKYSEGVAKLNKMIEYPDDIKSSGYRDFCFKWENTSTRECFEDVEFCSEVTKYRESWNGLEVLRHSSYQFTNEHFKALFDGKAGVMLELFTSDIITTLENYPEFFKAYLTSSQAIIDMKKHIDELEGDYTIEKATNNMNIYVDFLSEHADEYIAQKNSKLQEEKANAPKKFVTYWNDLIKDSFYQNTNEKLKRSIDELNQQFKHGGFALSDVENECQSDFVKLVYNHTHQYKKNQKIIATLAELLLSEYVELLDKDSIDKLSKYFSIHAREVKPITIVADVPVAYTQGTLF